MFVTTKVPISLMFERQEKIDYVMELYMQLFLELYLFRIVRLSLGQLTVQ